MGVPVGSLGGQKDSRGLGAEPRSARCPLRPGQSVYSVPPACFSGTPQCSGRSLDAPRLQRGKLRLRWGHSSRKHGREPCCRTKKQAPSCPPRSTLPPSAVSSAGRGAPDGRKPSGGAGLPSSVAHEARPSCPHPGPAKIGLCPKSHSRPGAALWPRQAPCGLGHELLPPEPRVPCVETPRPRARAWQALSHGSPLCSCTSTLRSGRPIPTIRTLEGTHVPP